MKILVVDDEPAILKMCAKTLRGMGHAVTACNTGATALRAALDDRFDLALCDINLPDVHGLEIVRAIKMNAPELPVIVMSALDSREWKGKALEAGADHFLPKPLRLDELRHEVTMAEMSRTTLSVLLHDLDDEHRMRLAAELSRGGCTVTLLARAADALEKDVPDLVILDAADPQSERVVRWAGKKGVHCFVLVDPKKPQADDKLMRAGASLIVQKPVQPEALTMQAKFLAARR